MLLYLLVGAYVMCCTAILCRSTKTGFSAAYAAAVCLALSGVHMLFVPPWTKVYAIPHKGDPHVFAVAALINAITWAGPYGVALVLFGLAWVMKFLGDGWADDYAAGTARKRT